MCGNCFYSPNHVSGGAYHNNHDCTITPLQSGYLDVPRSASSRRGTGDACKREPARARARARTLVRAPPPVLITTLARALSARVARARAPRARSWDGLVVNGLTYCGYDRILRTPTTSITPCTTPTSSSSPTTHRHAGFAICMLDDPPPSATPTPAPTPPGCDTATGFSIDSGDCTVCGDCFHTPELPRRGDYDHAHSCTITPLASGWLDVLHFEIEYSGTAPRPRGHRRCHLLRIRPVLTAY